MSNEKATEVLVAAVNIAQSKGAYTLAEARIITDAITALFPEQKRLSAPVEAAETKAEADTPKE